MDWELQARFEHIPDHELCAEGYLEKILAVLDVLAGEKSTTEKRRAVRRALFEGNRKNEESLSQFALRREQEFALAEQYVSIPSDLKAILMEENAGLGKQGVMNLRTLTSGSGDFNTVVQALKVLDTEEESITGRGKSSHFVGHAAAEDEKEAAEDAKMARRKDRRRQGPWERSLNGSDEENLQVRELWGARPLGRGLCSSLSVQGRSTSARSRTEGT